MGNLIEFIESFARTKKEGGICNSQGKLEELLDKIRYIKGKVYKDDFFWLATNEKRLLGVSLSINQIDVYNDPRITHTCKQVLSSRPNFVMTVGVDICLVREYTTKSGPSAGKRRADIVIQDKTAQLQLKVWSDVYEPYSHMLVENNCIIVTGERGYGKYSDFFIAKKIMQAG